MGAKSVHASLVNNSHSQVSGGSFSNNMVHTSQAKECLNKLVNEMHGDADDDDILEVILYNVSMKDCLLRSFFKSSSIHCFE